MANLPYGAPLPELLKEWRRLADMYTTVPGREGWDEYTAFIYKHEPFLIEALEKLEASV